jgi:hypothetical protein
VTEIVADQVIMLDSAGSRSSSSSSMEEPAPSHSDAPKEDDLPF